MKKYVKYDVASYIRFQCLAAIDTGMTTYEEIKNGVVDWDDILDILKFRGIKAKIQDDIMEMHKKNGMV